MSMLHTTTATATATAPATDPAPANPYVFARIVYELFIKFNLFTNNPDDLFIITKTPSSIGEYTSCTLKEEWEIVFKEDRSEVHTWYGYKLTKEAIAALNCVFGTRGQTLAYILLRFIPYSNENKYIEEHNIKLYNAFGSYSYVIDNLSVLMQTPNESEDRSTPLIGMIWQHGKYINEKLVRAIFSRSGGINAWTLTNSFGESASSLWRDAGRTNLIF